MNYRWVNRLQGLVVALVVTSFVPLVARLFGFDPEATWFGGFFVAILIAGLLGGGAPGRPNIRVARVELRRYRRRARWIAEQCGPQAPMTAEVMNRLGVALEYADRFSEAATVHEDNVERCRQVYGPDSIELVTARNNLATAVVMDEEDVARALELYETNRRALSVTAGPRVRLLTEHNIACCHLAEGRAEEAVDMLTSVHRLRRALHGPRHPDTIASSSALLAAGRSREGRPHMAHSIYVRAVGWQSLPYMPAE